MELVALISDTIEEFRFENPNFQFNIKAPSQKIELSLDPLRIYQVLASLLDNAVRHSGATSIDASLIVGNDVARVEVTDSIFNKGDSVGSRKVSGLGLGLFISKEIMKLHHGKIGHENRSGG